jgi:manganese/zinc/iron transport system permease protein
MNGLGITAKVMLGTALLGAAAGAVGAFAVLRKRSLVGDMLAHASLPGICLAFVVLGGRSLVGLSLGALVSGLVGIAAVTFLCRWTRTREDAAIGIVLSTFFGAGVVLLSILQQQGSSGGLQTYLFGQPATMRSADVMVLWVVLAAVLGSVLLLYKEFQLLSFDAGFARAQGWPTLALDTTMMGLLAVVTIVGLPIVGVVLMAAMIIVPGAAARFWTNRLHRLILLSIAIGAASAAGGTLVASPLLIQWLGFDPLAFGNNANLPPGPTIILAGTGVFVASLLFAPTRGVVARVLREIRLRRRIARDHVLRALYEESEPALPVLNVITPASLAAQRRWSMRQVHRLLRNAKRKGWIDMVNGGARLTRSGLEQAARLTRAHRLWELFLVDQANVAVDHVDRDADDLEHILPPELIERLERQLAAAGRWPAASETLPESPHELSEPRPDIGHSRSAVAG